MPGGHDQLFKDLIRSFPADFLNLTAPELLLQIEPQDLDLQPFRGRKKSTFLPTPPPEKPEPTCSSTGALPPPSGTATRSRY